MRVKIQATKTKKKQGGANVLVVEVLEETDLTQQPRRVRDVLKRVRHLLDCHVAAASVFRCFDCRTVYGKHNTMQENCQKGQGNVMRKRVVMITNQTRP